MRPKPEVTVTASTWSNREKNVLKELSCPFYGSFLRFWNSSPLDILYTYSKLWGSILFVCVCDDCLWSYRDSFCSSASPWCWSWWPPQGSPLSYDSRFWINCDWRRRRPACRWCCRRRTRHTCPPPFLTQDSRHSRGSVRQRREASADEEAQSIKDWGSHIMEKQICFCGNKV